ncbi:MAG TPA: hypothetical protein VLQ93_12780, partial [Myxococcaceae bacterium]|nr:hypothetical protein [Myxococcaceae bacterium]
VRPAPRSRSDSGTQTLAAPVEEEEEWEAPPSTEVGGRRRLTGARTSSRPEEARGGGGEPITGRRTGDAPAIRRSGMRMTPGADVEAPAPRPSRGGALALNARARPLEVEDDDDERTQLPEPEPPRRRTGQASSPQAGSPRQRASRAELSQAPARRRTSVEKENKDEPRPPVKGSKAPLPVKQLLGVVTALLLVGVVAVFHEPIWNMLNSSAIDGQALQINLESNEPVRISVRHGERCGGQGVSVLSDQTTTRLKGVGGVHVQDTLILENKQRGIFRELPIDYGEPNNTRSFRVEFKRGFIQLKLVPGRSLSGVEIYRDDQLIGRYPSAPIELMEGTHQLELRSQQSLKEPVPFEVQITAGQTTSRTVDVSRYLR